MKIVKCFWIVLNAIFMWFMLFVGIGWTVGMITSGITFNMDELMTMLVVIAGVSGGLTVKILIEMCPIEL